MKFVIAAMLAVVSFVAFSANAVAGDENDKVFVCKYVGTPGVDEVLQTGQNPISVSVSATGGAAVGSYFSDSQGRSFVLALDVGQPEPSVSECPPPSGPPPTDVCPNIEGVQETVPEGMVLVNGECVQVGVTPLATGATFTEATCTTPPAVQLAKTNIPGLGLRPFYNVEGPDFVDGHPVVGGTYTFTAISIVGYVLTGGTVFTHTFAAAPSNCGGTHVVTGDAQVICLLPAGVYQLSGHVDGLAADSVNPATMPGNTKGISNVVVTRGDTSVRTTVITLGDCGTSTTVTVTPPTTPTAVTTPATPATPAKPAKPAAKPKPKPKPTTTKKPKAGKPVKPTIHKCKPLKNGTKRVWVKGQGCHAVLPPEPKNLTG